MTKTQNLVWIDLEMTGLNPDKDKILEVGMIITDGKLKHIGDSANLIIHQSKNIINKMSRWCKKHHKDSDLIEKVQASKVSVKAAEGILLEIIKKYCQRNKCFLAGNYVYVDRMFLKKYMPKIIKFLHYRLIDVSSIKVLALKWYPDLEKEIDEIKGKKTHRSLDDIRKSIDELKFYRKKIFIDW